MTTDNISAIGINEAGQLFIKPETECFVLIWRSATEVHWNDKGGYLFSPKPREWSYLDWYNHIIGVVKDEYGCKLIMTSNTNWLNIPDDLKQQIIEL
jgi:hypothetical protein